MQRAFSTGPLNRVPFQESISKLFHPVGYYRESINLNYAPRADEHLAEGRCLR